MDGSYRRSSRSGPAVEPDPPGRPLARALLPPGVPVRFGSGEGRVVEVVGGDEEHADPVGLDAGDDEAAVDVGAALVAARMPWLSWQRGQQRWSLADDHAAVGVRVAGQPV